MDVLLPEHKELLLLLKEHDVRFILIGGHAVAFHGYDRSTGDMDIWLEPSNENKAKLIKALIAFGIDDEGIGMIQRLDFNSPRVFFFGERPKRIDFLTRVQNVLFEEAYRNANKFPLQDTMIPVIDYDSLILTKFTSRPKDKADIEELQKVNKHRKK